MTLTGSQRKQLRSAMLSAYVFQTLEIFLDEVLNISFSDIVSKAPFAVQCFELIKWAEREGRLDELCRAMRASSNNNSLLSVLDHLLQTKQPPLTSRQAVRPFLLQKRPILDRHTLWDRLAAFAVGTGNARILFINGQPASGKSYSRYLISHACERFVEDGRFVLIDLKDEEGSEVAGPILARRIAERLWPTEPIGSFDTLAQPARQVKQLGNQLLGRLAQLQKPTWLMIDALNRDAIDAAGADPSDPPGLLRIDHAALDLLVRLCKAVELNECPKLWLVLVGLGQAEFDPDLVPFLDWEETSRPTGYDIREYLDWFAQQMGKSFREEAIRSDVQELAAALPERLSHQAWRAFHKKLGDKCRML